MPKQPIKIYADTSVLGGVFDEEFRRASLLLLEQARLGRFMVHLSPIVEREIMDGPEKVREMYRSIILQVTVLPYSEEAVRLKDAYLAAGIVGPRWTADALHVAYASVFNCQAIVSWNFKHIVNFKKIALYNAINIREGYSSLGIHSPLEVIEDEDL
jgi:predicted nucleic acid-binding protein